MYIQDLKIKKIASVFDLYDCLPTDTCMDGFAVNTRTENGQKITEITYKSVMFRRAINKNVKYSVRATQDNIALIAADQWFGVADDLLAALLNQDVDSVARKQNNVSNSDNLNDLAA